MAAGDMGADLHKKGGFADARLASEEGDGAGEESAAEHRVEVGEAGGVADFGAGSFEVAHGDGFEGVAGKLAAANGGFFVLAGFGELLDERIPSATVSAAAGPFGKTGAAGLANEFGVKFGHDLSLA